VTVVDLALCSGQEGTQDPRVGPWPASPKSCCALT
jgi:hypothetical protein